MKLLQLKPLTPDLLPAVLTLDQHCFGGLWSQEGYQRELASPNSELLVLQEGNKATSEILGLGCLWAIVEEAHITILAVAPSYQRQGFGQAILWGLLSQAYKRQLERATLEVRASNQPALALYQKFKFQEAGRRKRYYQDTGEDALILWLGGLQTPGFARSLTTWDQEIQTRLSHQGWNWENTL